MSIQIFAPEPTPAGFLSPRASRDNRRAQTQIPTFTNVTSDGVRQAALEGDGAVISSMAGHWPASTNLCTNGGMTTNTTGYTTRGSATSFARTTAEKKFGPASMATTVVTGYQEDWGTSFGSGASGVAVSSSTQYTVSCWLKSDGTNQVRFSIQERNSGGSGVGAIQATVATTTSSATWVRKTFTLTTSSTTVWLNIYIGNRSGAYQNFTFWHDGLQVEATPAATPYIETDGSTMARTASSIFIPALVMTGTQGWVAMRVHFPYAQSGYPTTFPDLFKWSDDATHLIEGYMNIAGGTLIMDRANGGNNQKTLAISWAADAVKTLIFKWTSAVMALSIDGGVFNQTSLSVAPSLAATTIRIGANLYANVFWVATGSGVIADADAAVIGALGNVGNQPTSFGAGCKLYWQGLNSKALTAV